MFNLYDRDIIAVHTTCLSEVIGDDLTQILNKAEGDGQIPKGKKVFMRAHRVSRVRISPGFRT